jgi:hypothetical protein
MKDYHKPLAPSRLDGVNLRLAQRRRKLDAEDFSPQCSLQVPDFHAPMLLVVFDRAGSLIKLNAARLSGACPFLDLGRDKLPEIFRR